MAGQTPEVLPAEFGVLKGDASIRGGFQGFASPFLESAPSFEAKPGVPGARDLSEPPTYMRLTASPNDAGSDGLSFRLQDLSFLSAPETVPAMTTVPDSFGSLRGMKIVVTGASSGIGAAVAKECARGGAHLVLHCSRPRLAVTEFAEQLRGFGQDVEIVTTDFRDSDERSRFADRCFDKVGPVDAVVCNAGADLLTTDLRQASYEDRLDALLEVDVRGTITVARGFGSRFLQQGHGHILTIGWDQSDRGMEGESGELFATAKNAVMGFSRSLAVSLAPSVRVNCIAPGWIRTAWGETAPDHWQERVLAETPLEKVGRTVGHRRRCSISPL